MLLGHGAHDPTQWYELEHGSSRTHWTGKRRHKIRKDSLGEKSDLVVCLSTAGQ